MADDNLKHQFAYTDLRGWIDKHEPDIVLTGHVHQPPFRSGGSWADRIGDTWVFNPGRQTGPIPTRIEIDLGSKRAAWFSQLGTEELSLTDSIPPLRTIA